MARFTVTIPDEVDPGLWQVTAALLELVEAGSSGHCFQFTRTAPDAGIGASARHVRLGITVEEAPR